MEAVPQEVIIYTTQDKSRPYVNWLESCKDRHARRIIRLRITQLRKGNFANCESLKGGLFEMKIDSGPGYRIYFAKVDNETVLLLWGGTKRKQDRDIEKARGYLRASQEQIQ